MEKKWYKGIFYAKMDEDDLAALRSHFCEVIANELDIDESALGHIVIDDDDEQDFDEGNYIDRREFVKEMLTDACTESEYEEFVGEFEEFLESLGCVPMSAILDDNFGCDIDCDECTEEICPKRL